MKTRIFATLIIALLVCAPVAGQKRNNKKIVLTGRIFNSDTVPVQNVMVFADGKNTNVSTDAMGEFRLRLKPGIKKLSFFSIEYGGFELDYAGQEALEVIIQMESNELIVVPSTLGNAVETGYGKINEEDLSGSVSNIGRDRFKNRSYKNVYEMIVGEAPGVTVEGKSIRIRGITSINGSNDPLLIVDGSPAISLDHLSPADVESINILKGSETAIYGVRGAAGVVVITTRRGRNK